MSRPETTTLLAVGERGDRVVLQFPHPVRECVIEPETARQAAEAIARSAYVARYGVEPTLNVSQISLAKRAHLRARATLMIRSMQEAGASAGFQARELVAMLLAEL